MVATVTIGHLGESRRNADSICGDGDHVSDNLFPDDTPEQAEDREDRVWELLRSTPRTDPDRMQKARDAYLMDPTNRAR